LNAGEAARVGLANAFASDRLGLLVYLDVVSGSLSAGLEVRTDTGSQHGPEQRIAGSPLSKYRMFHWEGAAFARTMTLRLRADAGPAIVRVRDFYPLVENPHVGFVN
jgi:hypothetical protein